MRLVLLFLTFAFVGAAYGDGVRIEFPHSCTETDPVAVAYVNGPATRIFSFRGTDFTALLGTNSPDEHYSFSLVISTNMDLSTPSISCNTATDNTNWVYWTGTQFAAFPTNNLRRAYLNAYSANVAYIWTNSVRSQRYYARGVIYNVTQETVQGNMNCISEEK